MKTLILILVSFTCFAQVKRPYGTTSAKYGYIEYVPGDDLPLIIFLHGFGEKGNGKSDLQRLENTGIPRLIKEGKFNYGFSVLAPQNSNGFFNPDLLEHFIKYAKTNYKVDTGRVYLVGLSAGAISIWNYLGKHQSVTAVIPVSGNGNSVVGNGSTAANCSFAHVPLWAFHGSKDGTVNPGGSIAAVGKVNSQCYPPVKYKVTVYIGVGHDAWTRTFNLTGMQSATDAKYDPYDVSIYDWLLQFDRTPEIIYKPGIYVDGKFAGVDSVTVCDKLITLVR
jgi:predicted peptidase